MLHFVSCEKVNIVPTILLDRKVQVMRNPRLPYFNGTIHSHDRLIHGDEVCCVLGCEDITGVRGRREEDNIHIIIIYVSVVIQSCYIFNVEP